MCTLGFYINASRCHHCPLNCSSCTASHSCVDCVAGHCLGSDFKCRLDTKLADKLTIIIPVVAAVILLITIVLIACTVLLVVWRVKTRRREDGQCLSTKRSNVTFVPVPKAPGILVNKHVVDFQFDFDEETPFLSRRRRGTSCALGTAG